MTLGAALDANVLVPVAPRDTLLRAAEVRLYQIRSSVLILAEVERTLVREGLTSAEAEARLVATMGRAFDDAEVRGFDALIPQMTNDPKDRHVLAAAVAGGASVIVTRNLRHFPSAALVPHGIVAQTPDAFLVALLREDSGTMQRLLREQAGDLARPPRRLEDVLIALARDAPAFVGAVREFTAED
jgi:predicted nucleic acid-binding protein